jgi:vacuolar-type H+-ATPase subunit I/STV1
LGVLYSKSNKEGHKLYRTIARICKYLNKYTQAKEYFIKASSAGFDVDEELQEINMIIAKAEEEERRRKEEEERRRKEEIERKRIEAERKKEEELERIRLQEIEDEREAAQRRKDERERKEREAEEQEESEKEEKIKQEQKDSKIGSHEFKSSITRGGDAIFPEHIYVDDNEVTWEKKTGVFSKDSKTIPIKNITQIDIETSLIGAKIKIRSKGFGFIQGENFTKSDVKEMKSLIEKAQGNL